jgi:hypothetical protein
MKRVCVGLTLAALMFGGLGLTGLGAGAAGADPVGPYQWCPGQRPIQVDWDQSVCHTWWKVGHGQGNLEGTVIVADGTPLDDMWEGADPPASVPPPNLPPFLCRSEFPPQQCDAWGL